MTRSADSRRLPAAYWRLAGATGANSIGEGAFAAAVPLLAAILTDEPLLVSAVSAAVYLPWLVLSLPVGVLIDRYDRPGLMWRSQALQSLIAGVAAALAASDRLAVGTLVAFAFGLGACQVVVGIAAQTVLPDIVAPHLLPAANGYQQTITIVGRQFVGPPVGSLLFAVAVALPFGMDAGAFALSAMLLAGLPRTAARPVTHSGTGSAIRQCVIGLRWLAGHRLLRTLAILLGVNTFCFHLGNATLVLLATRTLELDVRGYGVLLAAAAVGGVLGGLVSAPAIASLGSRAVLFVALGTNVVAFVGIGLSPDVIVLGIALAINGFATTLWNVVTVSLRQQLVPAALLGRITSVYRMVGWGLIPLGALAGGLVAQLFGLRAPYPVAGGLRAIALIAVAPVLVRALRHR